MAALSHLNVSPQMGEDLWLVKIAEEERAFDMYSILKLVASVNIAFESISPQNAPPHVLSFE